MFEKKYVSLKKKRRFVWIFYDNKEYRLIKLFIFIFGDIVMLRWFRYLFENVIVYFEFDCLFCKNIE